MSCRIKYCPTHFHNQGCGSGCVYVVCGQKPHWEALINLGFGIHKGYSVCNYHFICKGVGPECSILASGVPEEHRRFYREVNE